MFFIAFRADREGNRVAVGNSACVSVSRHRWRRPVLLFLYI